MGCQVAQTQFVHGWHSVLDLICWSSVWLDNYKGRVDKGRGNRSPYKDGLLVSRGIILDDVGEKEGKE